MAQGLGIRLFAFGGAYWPLASTLCGPERVLVVSTEPPDDLSCLTTPRVGCPGDGLLPVPLTRCIQTGGGEVRCGTILGLPAVCCAVGGAWRAVRGPGLPPPLSDAARMGPVKPGTVLVLELATKPKMRVVGEIQIFELVYLVLAAYVVLRTTISDLWVRHLFMHRSRPGMHQMERGLRGGPRSG